MPVRFVRWPNSAQNLLNKAETSCNIMKYTISSGGRLAPLNGTPAPLKVKLILFYFLYSARSQKKSFNVTFPIEQVYTLLF